MRDGIKNRRSRFRLRGIYTRFLLAVRCSEDSISPQYNGSAWAIWSLSPIGLLSPLAFCRILECGDESRRRTGKREMKLTLAAFLTLILTTSLSCAAEDNATSKVVPMRACSQCSGCRTNRGCSGCGNGCQTQGSLLHKLLVWATYRPKEHVCSCTDWCASCRYKGLVPPYLYFQNPRCVEGSGIAPTFSNSCSRGCQSCAHP